MKLNQMQISKTLSQFRAQVLADDHPAVAQFSEMFGQHTYFLDAKGLYVLELLEVPGMEAENGEIVSLADWSDADFTKLTTHQRTDGCRHPPGGGATLRCWPLR